MSAVTVSPDRPLCRLNKVMPCLVESVSAGAFRADPQGFSPVLEHRTHRDAFVPARPGNMLEPAVVVDAEPAVRPDPQAAAAARRDGPGEVALQALGFACGREFSIT